MLNHSESIQQKAIKHLRIAIRNDHQHLPSIVSLCDILIESDNYDEAQTILKTALTQSKESAVLYYQQAKLSFKVLNYEEALVYIEKSINLQDNESKSYWLAYEILLATNQQHLAIPYLEKYTDFSPLDGRGFFELSKLLVNSIEKGRKKLLLEIAVDLLPNEVSPIIELALLHIQTESENDDQNFNCKPNYIEAEKLFKLAIEINPNIGAPWYFLGKLNLNQEKNKIAQQQILKAYQFKETRGKSAYQLGLLSLKYNNQKQAEDYFYESFKLNVKKSNCLFNISEIHINKKDYNGSLELLKKALQIVNKEQEYQYEKSKIYSDSTNFYLARKHLKAAFKIKEFHSKIIIKIYQNNKILRCSQQVEEVLTKAILLSPSYHEPYFEFGLYLVQENRLEEAKGKFTKACNNKWDHFESHFELGKLELECGDIIKATMHFEIVLDLNKSHKSASNHLKKINA